MKMKAVGLVLLALSVSMRASFFPPGMANTPSWAR
jgi:hypothetical protein